MVLRNGEHGYGAVTKTLHWVTVLALAAQLTVGYLMDDDGGRGRGRGHGSGGGDDDAEGAFDLLTVHVTLGVLILLLAIVRVTWRGSTPLPPWAETLSVTERRVATVTERALLATLFVIPPTGLVLVLGDDDLLWLHVAAHLTFFTALAAHLGLVLKHQLVDRDRLLERMT